MCMRLYLPILCVLTFLAISPNVATAAEPDPVGWWKFDDGAGAVALDSSGSGNHGTIFGDPQWIAGQLDGALQLDGAGDYVELPIGKVIGTLEEATLSLWVNWSGEGGDWQRILDLGSGTTNYLYLCPNNGSTSAMRVAITVDNGVWNEFDSSEGLLPLGWHHVTITVSSSAKRMELYLDGQSVGSMANITNTVNALGETTQNWIGRSQYDADPYFNGAVDDLRIYNVVLSDRQIQTVMSGLSTGLASGPVPANEAIDVPREMVLGWTAGQFAATHDVYFGTSFADVDAASRGNALGVLVSQAQAGTTYTPPVRLEFETTYYWRIDEVNAAPDNTVFKGEVWSFTTEPFTYPVANIIATSNA
ncbi:MAG: LamG domain-containing protein, partial [Phycisphaerae bacterium]|nr:LamG domain-containing protein [Phycisphaerae bacterium]